MRTKKLHFFAVFVLTVVNMIFTDAMIQFSRSRARQTVGKIIRVHEMFDKMFPPLVQETGETSARGEYQVPEEQENKNKKQRRTLTDEELEAMKDAAEVEEFVDSINKKVVEGLNSAQLIVLLFHKYIILSNVVPFALRSTRLNLRIDPGKEPFCAKLARYFIHLGTKFPLDNIIDALTGQFAKPIFTSPTKNKLNFTLDVHKKFEELSNIFKAYQKSFDTETNKQFLRELQKKHSNANYVQPYAKFEYDRNTERYLNNFFATLLYKKKTHFPDNNELSQMNTRLINLADAFWKVKDDPALKGTGVTTRINSMLRCIEIQRCLANNILKVASDDEIKSCLDGVTNLDSLDLAKDAKGKEQLVLK